MGEFLKLLKFAPSEFEASDINEVKAVSGNMYSIMAFSGALRCRKGTGPMKALVEFLAFVSIWIIQAVGAPLLGLSIISTPNSYIEWSRLKPSIAEWDGKADIKLFGRLFIFLFASTSMFELVEAFKSLERK